MDRVPLWLRKPLFVGVPVVAVVAGAVFFLGVDRADGGGHAAANRAQLKRACTGLLPYEELRDRVPDEVAGEVNQYGTVLDPGEESRSLVNCSVTWPGHGSVRVRAVALVSRMPMTVRAEDILPGGEDEGHEAPGVTGRTDSRGRTWVVAECPGGLEGRFREVSGMYVTADVDLAGPDKGEPAEYLADFRTAVRVANGITAARKCGGSPLKMPTRIIDTHEVRFAEDTDGTGTRIERIDEPGRGVKKCRGLGGRAGFPGKWTVSGDLQDSRLLSVCHAAVLDREDRMATDPELSDDAVAEVSAASWAGPIGDVVDEQYDRTGDSFNSPGKERTRYIPESAPHELALWARSQCAAGTTYHRVTVRTKDPETNSRTLLDEAERTRFSKDVRKLMDSYLADPDGWPGQQRCHDTEILSEAEGWR
ncbi:hypothetical protein [Streptomyces sp. ML-6]|uniref:hypothetical protein n=1 Tax=Streptomyces sp. ML-6 TaxID=2982693 RepID=UPI0024BF45BA|nr:hypothetical protein [Streptomyces sp. ML-6]MDK0518105.1 hypothetical protein [Streptomyces sp. ML-6]